jgi:hypothetical protein
MSSLHALPFAEVAMSELARYEARLVELTLEDQRLTSRQCALRLERGDVLNAILSECGDLALGELIERAGLSEQQAGQERWISARIPDYARNPEAFSWAAHREVAALEPEQIVAVFGAALEAGQTSQRAVREIARAMYGPNPGTNIADPVEQDWAGFLRMALVQHFAGRLSDSLIGEIVTQSERLRREWERAQEQIMEAVA